MKTKLSSPRIEFFELTKADLVKINGGGFAYDLGFFLRETVVCIINGGGLPGAGAVITDTVLNYKPR